MQLDPKLAIWLSQSLSYKYQETMATTISRILHPLIYNIALDIEQRFLDLLNSKKLLKYMLPDNATDQQIDAAQRAIAAVRARISDIIVFHP